MSALAPLLQFPAAVWTVLVGIATIYWLFVMSGLLHMGDGAHDVGELGGDVDALDAPELGHDVGGHDVGGHDVDAPHADADAPGGADDAAPGFADLFRLKGVPLTVAFSLVSFFAWILTLLSLFALARAGVALGGVAKGAIAFLGAPLLAIPLAKLATRPLAPLLTPRRARSARDLIGQSCTIRTGEATDRFGEALVKDTGADLVLRVRVEGPAMKRGEEGVIIGFDEAREEYVVAPLEEHRR